MTQRSFEVVAAIARLLRDGADPRTDETLAAVARQLREAVSARAVTIWLREPNATSFYGVSAPPAGEPAFAATVDQVAGGDRIPLGARGDAAPPAGLLQIVDAAAADPALVAVVADLLAPVLSALLIHEDLASELARHSRAVDDQRRFTGLIIDSLPVGLYVIDRGYRIQLWNRKRETGTQGIRRSDVVGRTVFDVLTRQPQDELRSEFDRVFDRGELVQSDTEVGSGASARTYRLTRIPMRLEGDTISHVITIGEDVSEWRAVQARILQSEKLAAIGQLAAGVMHEINNPLATIGACVAASEGWLGQAGEAATPIGEYLSIIDKEVLRCTRIVDGLLDFSRPKGKAKAPAELNAVVSEALFLLQHHARFKSIALDRRLDPELPLAVVNTEQIIQVIMALMLNALDAMEGGGRLGVRTARSPRYADEVVIEVEDSGSGIPAAEQSKIFEPFYTTKAPGRGTGLGLSICYGIVEDHRGRIEVESQPGIGSVFRVFLPAYEATA
jgi:two-component system NtrC family sensor kinase